MVLSGEVVELAVPKKQPEGQEFKPKIIYITTKLILACALQVGREEIEKCIDNEGVSPKFSLFFYFWEAVGPHPPPGESAILIILG